MRKRYSWLVLLFVIALVASACSSDDGETADTLPETTTTAADGATTTAAPSTTAAPAEPTMKTGRGVDADAKVITLGLLADLTGLFAPLVIDRHLLALEPENHDRGRVQPDAATGHVPTAGAFNDAADSA